MQDIENTLLSGTIVHVSNRDRYIIERLLGRGGTSAIYLVRDQRVKQNLYALKEIINPDKREREGFTFECTLLMQLEHQALPRVYRVFNDEKCNRAYVLMDYIEGTNLRNLLLEQPEKRFPFEQVVAIMAPIVDAIAFLHHQDPAIVHRDIKPANIIVSKSGEESILVDFGIAKVYEPEATTTAMRQFSPGYGAPEQYSSVGTTPQTDIYGLGATIYTLLTGDTPVDSLQRMIKLSEKEPDPLIPLTEQEVIAPVSAINAVHRAMSISSAARFTTVEEFWQAFTAAGQTYRLPQLSSVSLPQQHIVLPDTGQQLATIIPPGKLSSIQLRKLGMIAAVLLALLLLISLGFGAMHRPAPLSVLPTHSQKTTPTIHATSLPSPIASATLYPPIVSQYYGTISDILNNSTTKMSLSSIQQSDGNIRGIFTGLGLAGPFTGTVNPSGHLTFRVAIYAGSETIAFEGTVKLGGILAGSYEILNSNQQFTGESGLWSVSPA